MFMHKIAIEIGLKLLTPPNPAQTTPSLLLVCESRPNQTNPERSVRNGVDR
jgi:hypothetical protein